MPELPEVHTTVEGLKKVIIGKTIKDVWSDFHVGTAHGKRQTIKNKKYFINFKEIAVGTKIKSVGRIGKNVLIDLSNKYSIIVHMKMTGHLMAGDYNKQDPYNRFIHLIFFLSGGNNLVLSDMRKFASVEIAPTDSIEKHLSLGPDPFKIGAKEFAEKISKRGNAPVKTTLMDQKLISGIGNIYSDEILWQTGIHPLSRADKIPSKKMGEVFKVMLKILRLSIKHGGDSKSDYRNAFGEKGGFHNFHKAYGRKGDKCPKSKCSGIIKRMVVRGRSAHFCPKHQIKYER